MRIGIFGGSFDPVHFGHLVLAEQCREQAQLDKVLFIPAAVSPLKEGGAVASDKQRLEMLNLAIAGHPDFEVSNVELLRDGPSYTVETLEQLSTENADDKLFLLLGEDSLSNFFRWKDPHRIFQLATPLVMRRPGPQRQSGNEFADLSIIEPFMEDDQIRAANDLAIKSRLIDISSTDIRTRVSQQKSVRFLLPRAVEKYIDSAKIYAAK